MSIFQRGIQNYTVGRYPQFNNYVSPLSQLYGQTSMTSAAGERIDEWTALGLSSVLGATALLADSVASMPLRAFKVGPDGKRTMTPVPQVIADPDPESNIFEFNDQVISNINKYFKYVPKNIVSFYNHISKKMYHSSMDCKNDIINLDDINFNDINFNDINLDDINLVGEMYIGVNDYGFCTGIPYQGELPIDLITFIFYKYLKENVSNISFMGNLEDFIKINFIKLEFNLENLSKCLGQNHPEYLKYIESKKKI